MDGFMLERDKTDSDKYQFDTITEDVSVEVTRSKGWGEGRAVELAIQVLEHRYYQLFAKRYKR